MIDDGLELSSSVLRPPELEHLRPGADPRPKASDHFFMREEAASGNIAASGVDRLAQIYAVGHIVPGGVIWQTVDQSVSLGFDTG